MNRIWSENLSNCWLYHSSRLCDLDDTLKSDNEMTFVCVLSKHDKGKQESLIIFIINSVVLLCVNIMVKLTCYFPWCWNNKIRAWISILWSSIMSGIPVLIKKTIVLIIFKSNVFIVMLKKCIDKWYYWF